jgi:hypothetical protein
LAIEKLKEEAGIGSCGRRTRVVKKKTIKARGCGEGGEKGSSRRIG